MKNAKVKRGKKATVLFTAADPAPSIGVATVTIKIINTRGRLVKQLKNARVPANQWLLYSFRCRFPKGKYKVMVSATDVEGNRQTKVGRATLLVK